MINQHTPNQPDLSLKSDLAGEFPLYLYWPKDQSTLLYSKSMTELLGDVRVPKPLKVCSKGLSFLLQSGVVPPPKTAYQDIYILGIGDKAKVSTVNGQIDIQFSHEFPFLNANRLQADEMQPDEDLILQMLAEATISRIDESKPSFLFHSAGKDSNSIALALAKAGWQDKVTLITHKSKGQADESEISAKIAKQLGFKHQVLHEVDQLQAEHKHAINDYFVNAPFPCTDNVTLAYPLYAHQLPELKGANIIDGGGNDSYMMTPPTMRELKVLPLSKLTHYASFMRHIVRSESLFSPLIRTPAEWCGMSGLSFADTQKILPNAENVYSYWKEVSQLRKDWDLFDFKTSILTPVTASELHIRKARNFADSISSNLVLPFANQQVSEYFAKMPEQHLFDRKAFKNKLILRKILKDRIGLDSDALGKLGFSYDSRSIVLQNWDWMLQEIQQCNLWHQADLTKILGRMRNNMDKKGWQAKAARSWIYRLYLISAWYNKNQYF
ncbi:asparagine synthase (glutamine-hydrolysing) [Marinomonas alcarazii]|uniref:asparagine synthase (glutamine-hydrolyzing) n=1 Tax=Marinomonas alcarazii TaxID=491949 RepID=A0A318UVK8_9GAMM|nr:asparagine synthase-related protein [Marinomonas alcarazii]PYF79861.1 asparagine synthase (glutamine-hydrolysing) [Marinomonas alcarazii]